MQTTEILQKKIKTSHDLLSIVKTMKTLAAVNIRQYEGAVKALEEYNRIVDQGWRIWFHEQQRIAPVPDHHEMICLVLGSDQGMCGAFNETILDFLKQNQNKWRQRYSNILYWSVGERMQAGLLNLTGRIDEHFALPGSLNGIQTRVQTLVQRLEACRREKGMETVHILFNRMKGGAAFEPTDLRVLPLDENWMKAFQKQPHPGRCIPRLGLSREPLFRHLFSQYIFVSFYRALAQSLASENAARLQSMQAAEKNILEMEENLQQKFRETRQNRITSELLDIISGFEAIHDQE
jgi:F-type H+-transporting ATPase subunit gamma